MLRENEGNVIARSPCVSDGERLREMLQAERRQHAKVIKSSTVQHLLTKHEGGNTSKLWDISYAGPLLSFMLLSYYHSNCSLISHLPTSTS